jgi:Tol biopolymer transport system component
MKKKDWSDWKAESENVTSMSLLLEDDGIEGAPALLDQNTLIFESKKNGNYDLWTIDLRIKSGIRQITSNEGDDRLPCAHPDGKRFCFLSDRSEIGYYMGEIGKPTVISLVTAEKPYFGGWCKCDISPDGKTMLYVSGKYIWSYDFGSKTKTQLVQGTEPKFSPDGKKIVYRKISKQWGESASCSIWMMNSDGTEQTEIISGTSEYSYKQPSISPNGKLIMYLKIKIEAKRNKVNFSDPDIWICNIDGTEHTQITTHPLSDQEAIWADNNTIIFCSNRPQSGFSDEKWDLWQLKIY